MQDPKKQKYQDVDTMYEKFMELKDYDAQGRPARATYQGGFFPLLFRMLTDRDQKCTLCTSPT